MNTKDNEDANPSEIISAPYVRIDALAWALAELTFVGSQYEEKLREIRGWEKWIRGLGLQLRTASGAPSVRTGGVRVAGIDVRDYEHVSVADVKAQAVECGLPWPDSLQNKAVQNPTRTGSNDWTLTAQSIATELDEIDAKAGAHDSLKNISDRVAQRMRDMGHEGEGPRGPLSAATILREALQGGRWKRATRPHK